MALLLHYHPLASYCWKVLIALYEKDIAFEPRLVDLGDPDARAAFQQLWTTGLIPLLQDGERVIPETSVMIEYLDHRFPDRPAMLPGPFEVQLQVRLWDRLFDHNVMGPMQRYVAQQLRPEQARDALAVEAALKDIQAGYDLIEARLQGAPWAVGERFTLADCAAAPALFYAAVIAPIPESHRTLKDYFERLMARQSVQRVIREARPWFKYFPLRESLPERFLTEDTHAPGI